MIEFIDIAINITETLNKDRETLTRAKDKLEFVDETMDDSKRIIRNMARRVATNRCILALIILMLLGAIALIIWLSWFHKYVTLFSDCHRMSVSHITFISAKTYLPSSSSSKPSPPPPPPSPSSGPTAAPPAL